MLFKIVKKEDSSVYELQALTCKHRHLSVIPLLANGASISDLTHYHLPLL